MTDTMNIFARTDDVPVVLTTPTVVAGEADKTAAIASLEITKTAFLMEARRAFLNRLLESEDGTATVDEIRGVVNAPPHPNCWGAVPAELSAAGILERDSFGKANHRSARARYVTRWRLADAVGARDWLVQHSESGSAA